MPNDLQARHRQPEVADVAGRLRVAMVRMVRRLRRETDGEHTPSEVSALASVDIHGPLTLGELAEHEGVSRPSMTVLATALERQGLVVKQGDDADRRRVRVSLTERGRRVVQRSRTRRQASFTRRLAGLDAGDLMVLDEAAGILERLLREGA